MSRFGADAFRIIFYIEIMMDVFHIWQVCTYRFIDFYSVLILVLNLEVKVIYFHFFMVALAGGIHELCSLALIHSCP